MDRKTIEMMGKIMDTERMGYAYVYPSDGKARKEYLIATTPENMANFVGSHFLDAQKMVITDFVDRLILDTCGGFIDTCPDQKLCMEINSHLAPIQMGEKEAGEILQLDRDQADAYFAAEDRAAAMAEYGMECGMG
ncbi:hypothetical protein D7X48_13805 [bacterium D16-50]|nr:hypothetical protein D7X48_13805 [bacterium D16-50]